MKYLRQIMLLVFILCLSFFSCTKDSKTSKEAAAGKNFAESADGVPIHFKVQGEGDVSLVFVHGWCTDKSYWDAQIPSFKVYYRVVTLDLAGHGRSGKGRKNWTVNAFAGDVAAVVEKLDLYNVVLVGHDIAGPVILKASMLMPQRIIGLLGTGTFSDIYMESYEKEKIDALLSMFKPDFPDGMRRYVLENYFRSTATEDFRKKIILDMAAAFPEMAISALEDVLKFDGTAALKEIDLPIRSLNSDLPVVPFKVIRGNTEDFKLRFIPNTGHFLMIEDPQLFNRYFAEFLKEIILASY